MARRAKSGAVKVNFKDVESRKTPPEGDYLMKVLEAKSDKGPSGDMIVFTAEIAEGEYQGVKAWLYCPLQDNSLWKLHAFLTALGEEPPADEVELDLSDLVDKEFVGVLTHETYQGKKRAKLTDFDSAENFEREGKGGKKKKDKDAGDKKSKKDKDKKSKADKDDGKSKDKSDKKEKSGKKGDDGKKGGKDKKPKKYAADDVDDMDEDELAAVIKKTGIDVDLDDYKKLSKKVAAVKSALDDADLLDE